MCFCAGAPPDEFRAFFAYHDALMDKPGNLTKAEREMIVVATSNANQCQYCVVAHGAILRIRAKNPLIADQVAINYRKADLSARQKAMLDFGMKVCRPPTAWATTTCAAADAWLHPGRYLGHCRHCQLLRPVQPHGECHQHAAQRRVLQPGTLSTTRAGPRGPRRAAYAAARLRRCNGPVLPLCCHLVALLWAVGWPLLAFFGAVSLPDARKGGSFHGL
jgi:AhpD family alkylhydroperoxidase